MPNPNMPPVPPAPGAGASAAPPSDPAMNNPESGIGGGPLGPEGNEPPGMEPGMEPYSAQVIRRLHGDAQILLHEYDEMMYHLEHDVIKKHLDTKLRTLVKELEDLEGMMGQHHPGLSPLEGGGEGFEQYQGEPNMGEGELGEEPETEAGLETGEGDEEGAITEQEAEGETGEMPPKGEDEAANTEAVEADSEEVEEPNEEEAVEGMRTKNLRMKYGGKSIDGRTQQGMSVKGRAHPNKKILGKSSDMAVSAAKPDEERLETPPEVDNNMETNVTRKMPEHHVTALKNAQKDLGYWAKSQDWSMQNRMDSHHHYKTLDDLVHDYRRPGKQKTMDAPAEAGMDTGGGTPYMDSMGGVEGKCITGTELADKPENEMQSKFEGLPKNEMSNKFKKGLDDAPVDMAVIEVEPEPHPYEKPIKEAAGFFKDLSNTAFLTDEHRFNMAKHHEGLDTVLRDAAEAVNVQASDDVGSPEVPSTDDVGSLGEKSLNDIEKHLLDRQSQLVQLNNQIIALYNRIPASV